MHSSSAAEASAEAMDDETMHALFLHLSDGPSGAETASATLGAPNASAGLDATSSATLLVSTFSIVGDAPAKSCASTIDDIPEYALPDAQYIERTMLPLLLRGLEEVARVRPPDPLAFLGAYMICNNPQKLSVANNSSDGSNALEKLMPSWVSLPPDGLSTPALAEAVQQATKRFSSHHDATAAASKAITTIEGATSSASKKT
ncbi:hypothetical protein JKF63_06548 [Porcisia hertigi]|uniref:Uncharacterized protein n=1 Tax=Porcisia hertigi TaxID=2761500 RepID=A0A836I925_9TRYP|nr:hypothetical protein JKF63_06548 [Porcisia hertigi]